MRFARYAGVVGVAGLVLALAACKGRVDERGSGAPAGRADDGGTNTAPSPRVGEARAQGEALRDGASPAPVDERSGPELLAPPAAGEARRQAIPTLSSASGGGLPAPSAGVLRAHFGAGAGPFAVQRAELGGARTALLVARADGTDPIVLAVERDAVLWSKPRPVAGISTPVQRLAIAPRPDGGVALFGYVAPMRLVFARMWADDGYPYADIELAAIDACDALSAAYRPSVGWIVACASASGARAQRLREDGTVAWDHGGVAVGATSAVGAATIAFDTPSSWVLVQRAKGIAGDHALAWRYDTRARPLWAAPADVGPLTPARGRVADERLPVAVVPGRGVRIELPQGPGRAARAVEIASDGTVGRFVGRVEQVPNERETR